MGRKLKPDKKSVKDRVRLFEAIPDISGAVINICGANEVSVDGCSGIMDCYDDFIKIKTCDGTVTFMGNELSIEAYYDSGVRIKGKLSSVEFESYFGNSKKEC